MRKFTYYPAPVSESVHAEDLYVSSPECRNSYLQERSLYSSLMKSDSRYPLCSLCFMPDDVILTSILCPIYIVLVVMEHREVIGALGVLVDALVR